MADFIFNMLNVQLFVTKTIREIIKGYDDELLRTAATFDSEKVKSSIFYLMGNVNK